jgi:hypothetical protein
MHSHPAKFAFKVNFGDSGVAMCSDWLAQLPNILYVGQNRNRQNMPKMDRCLGRTKFPHGSQMRSMGVARLPRTMWQVGVTDTTRPKQ